MRNLDQLERGLVHRGLEFLVAVPVAVRLLDHDAALEQQPLEHLVDVEARVPRVAHTERDVLEVAEDGHVGDRGLRHGYSHPLRRKYTYGTSAEASMARSASG